MCPSGLSGLVDRERRSAGPAGQAAARSAFSARVLPVTVRQLPSSRPGLQHQLLHPGHAAHLEQILHHVRAARAAGRPAPACCRSGAGSRRARTATSAAWAMASRCSTALVEPPSTMTMRKAFSNAALVMICRGVRLRSSRVRMARPAASHSPSFSAMHRRRRGGHGQRHAHGLDGRGHGVGGVHAAAGARARTGVLHHLLQLRLGDLLGQELTVGLEGGDDVELAVAEPPGLDGAAVDHDAGAIDAGHGHQRAGHVLVAARPPRRWRRRSGPSSWPRSSRRSDRATAASSSCPSVPLVWPSLTPMVLKIQPTMPALDDALLHVRRQVVEVHVAGVRLEPGAGDADLGLAEVFSLQPGGVEHGPGARLRQTPR